MRMSVNVVVIAILAGPPLCQAQVPLTDASFRDLGATKGLVILQVNWGRYWKCGHFENAQLQRLSFRNLASSSDPRPVADWVLAPTSTLLTKPDFEPYSVYLDPGHYALSGYRFKVAASVSDVRVAEPGPNELIVDGKAVAGSFTVAAGEAVYIGHFGVDCTGEPTPWRFYIDGASDFARYIDGFHKKYPYMKDVSVAFRLFDTTTLGQPYELPK